MPAFLLSRAVSALDAASALCLSAGSKRCDSGRPLDWPAAQEYLSASPAATYFGCCLQLYHTTFTSLWLLLHRVTGVLLCPKLSTSFLLRANIGVLCEGAAHAGTTFAQTTQSAGRCLYRCSNRGCPGLGLCWIARDKVLTLLCMG